MHSRPLRARRALVITPACETQLRVPLKPARRVHGPPKPRGYAYTGSSAYITIQHPPPLCGFCTLSIGSALPLPPPWLELSTATADSGYTATGLELEPADLGDELSAVEAFPLASSAAAPVCSGAVSSGAGEGPDSARGVDVVARGQTASIV